jgi:HTH-type transcriptional regulator/antitoxin HipB
MQIEFTLLNHLAQALAAERKRQKLSREQAAAVCGVSASFIRDAESNPENCSLGKLVRLISGLGLSLNVAGLSSVEFSHSSHRPDFGVDPISHQDEGDSA